MGTAQASFLFLPSSGPQGSREAPGAEGRGGRGLMPGRPPSRAGGAQGILCTTPFSPTTAGPASDSLCK